MLALGFDTENRQIAASFKTRLLTATMLIVAVGALAQRPAEPRSRNAAWPDELEPDRVRLAQSTEAVSQPTLIEPPPKRPGPPGRRQGLLQSVNLTADWAPRLDEDSVGRTSFAASLGLGVPPMVLKTPLLVTPRAALHLVDGPDHTDVPARLNDLEIGFGTFKKLSDRWSTRLSVTVGVYGDDHSLGESDALRVSGFGVALYQASPEWQWAIGAAYLNRDDIAVVPAIGVIYDSGAVRYELMAPRPRIVWSLPQDADGSDRSIYLGGELGGGAWAVRRTDGTTDTLNLGRFGLVLGYETGGGALGAGARRYEIGYLFGRNLEYAESGEDISLDDSLIARVGWRY